MMATNTHNEKQNQILNVPNVLTVIRIILVPIFAYFLYASVGETGWKAWLTLILFLVAAWTDHFDGHYARKWNIVTNFGKIMDPIADKALMITAFVMLSIFDGLFWWFTIVVIIREVAVTILRWWLLKREVVLPANKGGKAKTVLQMGVAVFMLVLRLIPASAKGAVITLSWIVIVLVVLAFAATVVSGFYYFYDTYKALHPAANSEDATSAEPTETESATSAVADTEETAEAEPEEADSQEADTAEADTAEAETVVAAEAVATDGEVVEEEAVAVAETAQQSVDTPAESDRVEAVTSVEISPADAVTTGDIPVFDIAELAAEETPDTGEEHPQNSSETPAHPGSSQEQTEKQTGIKPRRARRTHRVSSGIPTSIDSDGSRTN